MISVIIPAYNAAASLGRALEALQHQSVPRREYEILVVDDGSTDDTRNVAQPLADRVIAQDHAGPAAARNRGALAAQGDILVFTDSDCEPCKEWLANLTEPFTDHGVMAVKGAYKTHQKQIVPRFAQVEFEERYRKLRSHKRIDFVDTYSAAIRRTAFEEVGGFDLRFPKANNEDVDLSYKLAARGYRMVFAPEAIVYHHHPESLWKYLRTKFLRAYWRFMVYSRHPAKLLVDSYTPQLLKIQSGLVPVFVALAILWGAGVLPVWVPTVTLVFLILCSGPLVKAAVKQDPGIVPWIIPLAVQRALALGLGAMAGFLSHRQRDLLIPLLLVVADGGSVILALLGAFYLRSTVLTGLFSPFVHDVATYTDPLPVVLIVWFASFAYLNLYATRVHTTPFVEFLRVLRGSVFSLLVIMSLSFLVKFDYSRFLVLVFFLLVVPITALLRSVVRGFHKRLLREGYRAARCIVIGSGEMARSLLGNMLRYPTLGYRPVGVVSSTPLDESERSEVPWLGRTENLASIISGLDVDEVFLADSSLTPLETVALALACDGAGASCKVVSDFSGIVARREGVTSPGHLPVVDLSRSTPGPAQHLMKTSLDYGLGMILVIVSAPIILLALVGLSLSGVRNLFIREERVGRGGHYFSTTRLNTIDEQCFLCRVLRRSGLDRLPRLVAVLRGQMSLVGPRGEPPGKVAEYPSWERLLLEVKPGLTGLWLVGRAGDIDKGTDVEYDFYYLRNRSFLLDLVILMRTLPALWRSEGRKGA